MALQKRNDELVDLLAADFARLPVVEAWTPTLSFGLATTGITYSASNREGKLIRLGGGLVYIYFDFTLTSKGSATGVARIEGLPDGLIGQMTPRYYTSMASITGALMGYVGSTRLSLGQQGATAYADLTDANFTNTTRLNGSAWAHTMI